MSLHATSIIHLQETCAQNDSTAFYQAFVVVYTLPVPQFSAIADEILNSFSVVDIFLHKTEIALQLMLLRFRALFILQRWTELEEEFAGALQRTSLFDRKKTPLWQSDSIFYQWLTFKYLGKTEQMIAGIDSLRKEYGRLSNPYFAGIAEMIIADYYGDQDEFALALDAYERALDYYDALQNQPDAVVIHSRIGTIFWRLGDFSKALDNYGKALDLAGKVADDNIPNILVNIGMVHGALENIEKSLEYYHKALEFYPPQEQSVQRARVLLNIGVSLGQAGDPTASIEYFQQAYQLYKAEGNERRLAVALGNIGTAYIQTKDFVQAERYLTEALTMRTSSGDTVGAVMTKTNIAELYKQQGDYDKALTYLTEALDVAEAKSLKLAACDIYMLLSEIYKDTNKPEKALDSLQKHFEIHKQIQSEEAKENARMIDAQWSIALARKEREVTDKLLHNILPVSIADRIKRGERMIADQYHSVSILFADIVNFTALSQRISAKELVAGLDDIFSLFDEITEQHQLEKIKTIGDAYMAVSGIPLVTEHHALYAAKAAIALMECTKNTLQSFWGDDVAVNLRIGLHSGSAVAGVIGKKKFSYDIWGDAVNTASRMESHGFPGKIHCSEEFIKEVRNGQTDESLPFHIVERGFIDIKGKGLLKTYFIEPRM